MKRLLKKTLAGALIATFALSMTNVYAQDKHSGHLTFVATEISDGLTSYVKSNADDILSIAKMRLAEKGVVDVELSIGNPIELFGKKTETYFPILQGGEIVYMVSVTKMEDEQYGMSIGEYFADKLNELPTDEPYMLAKSEDGGVYAISEEQAVLLADTLASENNAETTINSVREELRTNDSVSTVTETLITASPKVGISRAQNPDSFYSSYRILPVSTVKWGPSRGQNCWAAASAAIINYRKGTSYTADQIDQAVHGNETTCTGGSTSDIQLGFSKYGFSTTATGLTFASKQSYINSGKPMYQSLQSGSSGHGVFIKGYGISTGSSPTYWLMIGDSNYVGQTFDVKLSSSANGATFTHDGYTSLTGTIVVN